MLFRSKRRIIREEQTEGRRLSRNPDGTYRVLAPEELGVHDRALAINNLALTTLKKKSKGPR